ncbi:hypothetical protein GN956_G3759 [Arapaima gigas]
MNKSGNNRCQLTSPASANAGSQCSSCRSVSRADGQYEVGAEERSRARGLRDPADAHRLLCKRGSSMLG